MSVRDGKGGGYISFTKTLTKTPDYNQTSDKTSGKKTITVQDKDYYWIRKTVVG